MTRATLRERIAAATTLAAALLGGCGSTRHTEFTGTLLPDHGGHEAVPVQRQLVEPHGRQTILVAFDVTPVHTADEAPARRGGRCVLLLARVAPDALPATVSSAEGTLEAWLYSNLSYADYVWPQSSVTFWRRSAALTAEERTSDPRATPLAGRATIDRISDHDDRFRISMELEAPPGDPSRFVANGELRRFDRSAFHPEHLLLLPMAPFFAMGATPP